MKLTKKHTEIIETVRSLEIEHNTTIYFLYREITNKVHPAIVESIEGDKVNFKTFPSVCTHNVAMTMMKKGIIAPETITTYSNGSDLKLSKIAI